MANTWSAKDPQDVLDYQRDWSPELGADTISTSLIEVISGHVAIDSQDKTATASTCWLSGGTDGETALFRVTITTAGGRTFEDTIALSVVSSADVPFILTGYVPPSPANLVALYPAFAAVPRATIQIWLTRAEDFADTTWEAGDYPFALLAWAAHRMTLQGLGTGAEAAAAAAGASGFRVMRSGALTLERFDTKAGGSASQYDSTAYGRDYLTLLRKNRAGARITGYPATPLPTYGSGC